MANPEIVQYLNLIVVSPGDVQWERKRMDGIIKELKPQVKLTS